MATGCPMMNLKIQSDHPFFGGDHSKAGSIHLPVLPIGIVGWAMPDTMQRRRASGRL